MTKTEPALQASRDGSIGKLTPTLRLNILLQSGVQASGKVGGALSAIVLLGIITRYLGPDTFGRYTFVTAYVALFYVATDLGSQAIAVREMSRHPAQVADIAGQLLSLKAVLSASALVVAVAIAWTWPSGAFGLEGVRAGVVVASLALLSVPLLSASGAIFQTRLRMAVPTVADVLGRFVSLLLVVGLTAGLLVGSRFSPSDRLFAVLVCTVIGSTVSAVVSYLGVRRLESLRLQFDRRLFIPLVRDAVPLAIVFVLSIVHYRVDVFILAAMRPMRTVGAYGIATRLLDVCLAGSAVFMGLAFPVLSRRAAGEPILLQRAFQKTLDIMLITGVAVAFLVSTLADPIVHTLASNRYDSAIVPVAIIAWAIPVSSCNMVFAHMVVAANRQRSAVPVTLAAIVLNVGLNVALIPHIGAAAPALVTVGTETAGTAGIAAIMIRHYRFGPSVKTFLKVSVSGFAGAIVVLGIQHFQVVVAGTIGILVYIGCLGASRVVRFDDLRSLVRRELPA